MSRHLLLLLMPTRVLPNVHTWVSYATVTVQDAVNLWPDQWFCVACLFYSVLFLLLINHSTLSYCIFHFLFCCITDCARLVLRVGALFVVPSSFKVETLTFGLFSSSVLIWKSTKVAWKSKSWQGCGFLLCGTANIFTPVRDNYFDCQESACLHFFFLFIKFSINSDLNKNIYSYSHYTHVCTVNAATAR